MSVVSVKPKDFILALFIRDDNERFLLGDNGYDFMDSQLHFAANTIENDEVEKQGADGTMLAGQVRRASVQTFDGYVGDATTPKETIEEMRRAFLAFFLKGHHYRVVYVDTARNAWQRKGGYLVDAPEVKELFQIHPEYHVGLNFEDVNYYSYDENADGDEITANLVEIAISSAVEGGLIWDNNGAVSDDATFSYITETAQASGKNIAIEDATNALINSIQIDGETSQQTYTGKNLLSLIGRLDGGITGAITNGSTVTVTGTASGSDGYLIANNVSPNLPAGTYTLTIDKPSTHVINLTINTSGGNVAFRLAAGRTTITKTLASAATGVQLFWAVTSGTTYNETFKFQLVSGSTPDYDYEPYVGGVPAPNPDYPQAVQTVTGENVVKISDGQGNEQSYEVNLGKNLAEISNFSVSGTGYSVGASSGLVSVSSTTTNRAISLSSGTDGGSWLPTYNASSVVDHHITSVGGTYILSLANVTKTISGSQALYVTIYTNKRAVSNTSLTSSSDFTPAAITLDSDEYIKDIWIWLGGNTTYTATFNVQLEKGSQATSYAAYFEPIELCKIGTYQDYIYKSGGKWYVHKEVGKSTIATLTGYNYGINTSQTNTTRIWLQGYISQEAANIQVADQIGVYKSNYFEFASIWSRDVEGIYLDPTTTPQQFVLRANKTTIGTNATSVETWLSSNPVVAYYALATPTDTEITNETLVAQLEAILSQGYTYAGTNNIALIPSGNEQGSLEITYYTKYIIDITAGGYEWEQGGSGGPTVIMNDSIDYVYPIWTITGPITNPVLENTTTGEQIEYVGTISDGQTLVIDMGEQTALLDGLNVLSSVAGEFISLAPGANTLLYSASSGNEPSEIGWSEIVG